MISVFKNYEYLIVIVFVFYNFKVIFDKDFHVIFEKESSGSLQIPKIVLRYFI